MSEVVEPHVVEISLRPNPVPVVVEIGKVPARLSAADIGCNADIAGTAEVLTALQTAGFELLDAHDRAPESDPQTPWYHALQGRDLSLSSIPRTPFGRALTNLTLRVGERLRAFPEGSRAVSTLLNAAADALVEGGKSSIFTPMFFFLARKPERPEG